MIRALVQAGLDIHVAYGPMASEWARSDPSLARYEPWDVPLLDGYPFSVIEAPFWFGPAGFFYLRRRIIRFLRERRPEAVWIHGWGDAYSIAAWNAAWHLGIPVLLRGESHLKCLRGGRVWRWLHRRVLSNVFQTVFRFLAIGTSNRRFYRSYGVPEHRIVDVPYAVDCERFGTVGLGLRQEVEQWRSTLKIPLGEKVVGFFGKLNVAKRPDLALRAVAAASEKLPPSRRPWLLFVGDGPLRRELERLAAKIYHPGRVLFLGFRNQSKLPALYHLTDILVLPSDFEPWGLVVNEAMCAGSPAVVSNRVGAAADLVVGTGRVFPSGSVNGLTEALLSLLEDEASLNRAGELARRRIRTWSFDEDVAALQAVARELPRPTQTLGTKTGVIAAYLGVHQVFQMGAAAAEAGRLEHFYCSLIRFPSRWGDTLARWFFVPSAFPLGAETLPPDRVTETPLPLLVQRFADHFLRRKKISPLYTNRWFATHVARKIASHPSAGIMVAAETCALELFVVAKSRGMRCVMDCHGIPTRFLQDGISRAADEFGLRAPRMLDSPAMAERKVLERELADVLVLCSETQRQAYLSEGLPAGKMCVVPLWVDTRFWHTPACRQPQQPRQSLRVLYAGAGCLAKGLPYLLAALNKLGETSVELTLVGGIDADMKPLLNETRATIRCLPYGPRERLREMYWSHDVLVMPTLGDSFGFVVVEAMACGLPVIVTDRCGAPVPDPSWRVPAFSSEAIARRLEHYRAQPGCLVEDGISAAEYAVQWTSDHYRRSIRRIYDELAPMPVNRSI